MIHRRGGFFHRGELWKKDKVICQVRQLRGPRRVLLPVPKECRPCEGGGGRPLQRCSPKLVVPRAFMVSSGLSPRTRWAEKPLDRKKGPRNRHRPKQSEWNRTIRSHRAESFWRPKSHRGPPALGVPKRLPRTVRLPRDLSRRGLHEAKRVGRVNRTAPPPI